MGRSWLMLALVWALTACAAAPDPGPTASSRPVRQVLAPAPGGVYHCVLPAGTAGKEDDMTPATLASYEKAAGREAAWVYLSNNWFTSRAFPLDQARWIRDAGAVPFVRLMLRSSLELNQDEPEFTLDRLIAGDFDADLHAWARAARDFGTPVLAEWGTEANGDWFSWSAVRNGKGRTDGYGDPDYPDGPERFRDAYRHIIDLMRHEGATNITWFFHVVPGDVPSEAWPRRSRPSARRRRAAHPDRAAG